MGNAIFGAKLQTPEPSLKRPERSALAVPMAAVSEILGKKAARAAPMLALAALSWCSAARTSGRCSRISDERPAETSRGGVTTFRSAGSSASAGGDPHNRVSAFTFWATACVHTAICTRAAST